MHINAKRLKKHAQQLQNEYITQLLQDIPDEPPIERHIEYDEDGEPVYIMQYADGRKIESNAPLFDPAASEEV